VDISFEHISIEHAESLPDTLVPDSADRVVVSNVLTDPRVARHPEICEAIARTTMTLVRKEPPGEVLIIGTLTPRRYPQEAVRQLLGAVGLEYVGSDDIGPYVPDEFTKRRDEMYVDRFRPTVVPEEANDTSVNTEVSGEAEVLTQDLDDKTRRRPKT
jgi:hypothetical protein